MVKLMEVVLRDFPQISYDIDEELRPYHKYRHELCGVLQGQSYHPIQTETTGVGDHPRCSPGGEFMISRVEGIVFWPGISSSTQLEQVSLMPRVW